MSGYGVLDFMARTVRNNKALFRKRKPLKKIYEENNLHYIKKRIHEKTQKYNPEQKRIFLEKFYARQKRIRKSNMILLLIVIIIFTFLTILLLKALGIFTV